MPGLPSLLAVLFLILVPQLIQAAELILGQNGQAHQAQFAGAPWKEQDGNLSGLSDNSRLVSQSQIIGNEFHLKAKLTLPKLSHRDPEIGFGPFSYLKLDGNGGRFILGGPLFIPDEQMIRYSIIGKNDGLISAEEPFLFEAKGAGGWIEFSINGQTIHKHELLRQSIGPVSLFPGTGELQVSEFTITAPDLQPYHPGNINSYGVLLDNRVKWRPELRKASFVKLADGSLAYLNNANLMISHDEGLTFEKRPTKVLSDKFGPELMFSSGLLLQTQANNLIAVMVNARNYVHLQWDDEQQKAVAGRREGWTMRSTDEGRTWTDLQRIYDGYCGALVYMIHTSTGNIVVPVQEFIFDRNTHITRAYVSEDE